MSQASSSAANTPTADRLVPIIDISAPLNEPDRLRLDQACRDHGFFLLAGHGLDELIADTWRITAEFFAQDADTKRRIMRTEDLALGYYDRELTKRKRDQKEVFDFAVPTSKYNRWPTTPAGFQSAMTAFYDAFSELSLRTLDLVYSALQLPPEISVSHSGNPKGSNVRLNYYPMTDPLSADERSNITPLGELALHHHTDPGVITLLLQDDAGGLQCHSTEHGWIDVPPTPGTIVVNLGDAMQVWSNDRYKAASHRVLKRTHNERFSAPYFLNPQSDAVLAPIAELCADSPARYRSFTWREFINGRISDNFADLGEDDLQIDRYRVTTS